jgi:hypothetical protein
MKEESDIKEDSMKVREKTDFERLIFEKRLNMGDVLADGDLDGYELLQNNLLSDLDPYLDIDQKSKIETIRSVITPPGDTSLETQGKIRKRIEEKDKMISNVLHDLGTQFTIRKKARIKGGLPLIWKAYPPLKLKESQQ